MIALLMISLLVSVSFLFRSILWMVSLLIRAPTVYNAFFAIFVYLLCQSHAIRRAHALSLFEPRGWCIAFL